MVLGDLDVELAADVALGIGPRARALELDVTDPESFAGFADEAGPLDVLVNNAGIMPEGPFLEEEDRVTRAILDVNVVGPVNGMRAVVPGMVARGGGHVVNVASMLGRIELPGLATYTASKHAVVGLGAAVRAELAGTGVALTTVLPAVVNTELSSGIAIPFARFLRVEPEDVARAVVRSVERRPREVSVPRWAALYPMLRPFFPSAFDDRLRRAVGDDKALTAVDPAGRAAYSARIGRQGSR